MRFSKSLMILSMSAALSACGGSSSDESSSLEPNTGETAPSTTTMRSEGVITGFGSVYVNGQRYGTGNATISVGDSPTAEEAQLKVGMMVKVAASRSDDDSDPEASEISYEEHLQGPVSFIDSAANVITVLGQSIVYDNLTKFEDTDIDTLSINDFIEVSGYFNESGGFYATLIELEDDNEIKLRGEVSSLDTNAQTFVINLLTIDYNTAEFDDMSSADLANGLFVKVEGTNFDSDAVTLFANSIEDQSDSDIDEDIDEVKIAGIVRDYDASAGTFAVNRYTVSVNNNTDFDNGTTDNLVNGTIVKVEGQFVDGQLIASEVEFKATKAQTKTEGQVADINYENGTFNVNGLTFTVNQNTRYEDESDLDDRQFILDKIVVNDWLKVFAAPNSGATSLALRVKRIEMDDRDGEVRGVALDVSETGMTVGGINVLFTDGTHFDTKDDRISLTDFLSLIEESNALIVEVEGEYEGSFLVAKEVDIQHSNSVDEENNRGRVEFKGSVESINESTVVVHGNELRFDENSELEINDQEVSVSEFIQALSVGSVIDVEGVWRENSFILVLEAELETEDEDDGE